ncbi:glycosyltransferase [Citrus sinensis]|nr:glycosyltransferase [Citrus sinensis]
MMLDKFLDLLTKLNDSSSRNGNQPAVSCIISDGFMPFTIEAAQQLGLSVVMFLTISACSFMGYKQFRTLKEEGLMKAVLQESIWILLLTGFLVEQQNCTLNSIGYNLWKKETECLRWLDSKVPNSVIYVNFGIAIVVKKQQFIEVVAMGLENSNHPFLWIIRPDLVTGGGDTTMLPSEFEAKAKGKGFIARSTYVCWPFEGDQMTNCRYTCKEWGVGMEINGDEDRIRNEIQKSVRELLEGEKGKQMRNKASGWKKLAVEAAAPDGPSSKNLEKLVNEILLPKEHIPAEI